MGFHWFTFSELTLEQLYGVLALRAETFIVEQRRVCLDIDGLDRVAYHLLGVEDEGIVAYLRIFPHTDMQGYVSFGRVLTVRGMRLKGYGKLLMREMLGYCNDIYPNIEIRCFAQLYLKKFYEGFGFKVDGEVFKSDGIGHVFMRKFTC